MKKILFLIAVVIFSLNSSNLAASTKQEIPKLVLSAQATLYKPADELQLKIGVVTLGKTAESTCIENNTAMQKVLAAVQKVGLVKGDYETGQFSIQPTYTPYPRDPSPDWRPQINGYEVTNSLTIHTDKLELAGKIIDLANKAGANSITDIHFGLSEPRLYWSEALSAAATNAVEDARALAQATGVDLVRVLSITLDNTRVQGRQINAAYLTKSTADSTPIEPGEVTLTAHVTLTYEIASRN